MGVGRKKMNLFSCVACEVLFHGFCDIQWAGLGNEQRAATAILRLIQHHIWPIKLSACDMVTESITIQGLYIISLALTPIERWESAKNPHNIASAAETWLIVVLTVFAVLTIIVSAILLFWARAKYRHIAKLTAANENLRQEIAKFKPKGI